METGWGIRVLSRHSSHPRAFSIVELLVSISIIAVLIAISLPAIASVRKGARFAVRLSEIRQMGVHVHAYTGDSSGYFPYILEPGSLDVQSDLMREVNLNGVGFRLQSTYYTIAMERSGYDIRNLGGQARRDEADGITVPEEGLYGTWYAMTHATAAGPEFWAREPVPLPPDVLSGSRLSSAAFPSNKALLMDRNLKVYVPDFATRQIADEEKIPWAVVFMDGSGSIEDWGFQPFEIQFYRALDERGMVTIDGMLGRDR